VEELAFVDGYDMYGGQTGELLQVMREAGDKVLDAALEIARSAGVDADKQLFDRFGERLGEVVANAAREWNADLIVLGTHGRRGIGRVLLGSGAEQIIRLAPTPVLVIRSGDETTPRPA
jgi:nucleotide-binding universal stress UspA family protein